MGPSVFEPSRDHCSHQVACPKSVREVSGLWSGARKPEAVHQAHLSATMPAGLDMQRHNTFCFDCFRGRATHTSRIQPVGFRQPSLYPIEFREPTATTLHWQKDIVDTAHQ